MGTPSTAQQYHSFSNDMTLHSLATPLTLLVLFGSGVEAGVGTGSSCDESDERLAHARGMICGSLVGTPGPDWCLNDNPHAQKDWPTQAVYMKDLLDLLVDSDTCLDTAYAADTANWLDGEISDPDVSGSYMWTYLVFQVQYYDMPRNEGDR